MLALLVDDNKPLLVLQELLLRQFNLDVVTASSAEEALAIANGQRFDLAVVDYHLPKMNGAQLARELKRRNHAVRVLLMSGSGEVPLVDLEAADDFLVKGQHQTADFLAAVRRLVEKCA